MVRSGSGNSKAVAGAVYVQQQVFVGEFFYGAFKEIDHRY
jgi:hypothetical protein